DHRPRLVAAPGVRLGPGQHDDALVAPVRVLRNRRTGLVPNQRRRRSSLPAPEQPQQLNAGAQDLPTGGGFEIRQGQQHAPWQLSRGGPHESTSSRSTELETAPKTPFCIVTISSAAA